MSPPNGGFFCGQFVIIPIMTGIERSVQFIPDETETTVAYQLAIGSAVFDSETGEGDPSVLASLRESALEKARIVLGTDPTNGPARRVVKWVVSGDKNPNWGELEATFRNVGLETYSAILEP